MMGQLLPAPKPPLLLDQDTLDFMAAARIYLIEIKGQFARLQREFVARGLDASEIDHACVYLRNIDCSLQSRGQQHRQAVKLHFKARKAWRLAGGQP